jgi:hypothetical protein
MALGHNQALLAMLAGVSFLRLISAARGRPRRARSQRAGPPLADPVRRPPVRRGDQPVRGHDLRRPPESAAPLTPLQATGAFARLRPGIPLVAVLRRDGHGAEPCARRRLEDPVAGRPAARADSACCWPAGGWRGVEGRPDFVGYPSISSAMWIPALLAAVVLGWHQVLAPDLPILTLISSARSRSRCSSCCCVCGAGRRAAGPPHRPRPAAHVRRTAPVPRRRRARGRYLTAPCRRRLAARSRLDSTPPVPACCCRAWCCVGGRRASGDQDLGGLRHAGAAGEPDPELMAVTYLMAWAAGVSAPRRSPVCISACRGASVSMRGLPALERPLHLGDAGGLRDRAAPVRGAALRRSSAEFRCAPCGVSRRDATPRS